MPQNPLAATIAVQQSGSSFFSKSSRMGKTFDLFMGQRVPSNYEETYNGNMFMASNQTGATLSNALATTYTGFCLSNPIASTVNLILVKASLQIIVATSAIQAFGLITGSSAAGVVTHTTPITAWGTSFVGNGTPSSQAKVDAACTIVGTPVWSQFLGTLITTTEGYFTTDFNGSIVIAPGGYIAFGAFGAAGPTSGALGSMIWAEEAL